MWNGKCGYSYLWKIQSSIPRGVNILISVLFIIIDHYLFCETINIHASGLLHSSYSRQTSVHFLLFMRMFPKGLFSTQKLISFFVLCLMASVTIYMPLTHKSIPPQTSKLQAITHQSAWHVKKYLNFGMFKVEPTIFHCKWAPPLVLFIFFSLRDIQLSKLWLFLFPNLSHLIIYQVILFLSLRSFYKFYLSLYKWKH